MLPLWLGLLFFWTLLQPEPSPAAPRVTSETLRQAQQQGTARVVVTLNKSPGTGPSSSRTAWSRIRNAMPPNEMDVVRVYESVPGFSAVVSPAGLEVLASSPDVDRVDLDMEGGGALGRSVPQISADRVHRRDVDGRGTVVAVLDTGVDSDHPDLADALIAEECFCTTGCCPNGTARQSGPGSAESQHPHGVHVSGIAVSRGRISSPGVAPGASLVAIRVLNDQNRGFLSDWLAGLDWILTQRPDVRVINMSLVSDALFATACDDDNALTQMFAEVMDRLYARGTIVLAAAGNNGQADRITAPACIDSAIAVGAVSRTDEIAFFSNSGPLVDVVAPGVEVLSDAPGGGLTTLSGTSMASPHAAGVASLLLAAQSGASAAALEAALVSTGVPIRDPRNGLFFPRIDSLAASNELNDDAELLRSGGSRFSDCLVQWNFIPPAIGSDRPVPLAECRDNDPSCDADDDPGQCTFLLSLCFNVPDARLPSCAADETILSLSTNWPPAPVCAGDCDKTGQVEIQDLIRGVAIGLFVEPTASCPAADLDDNGLVEVPELVTMVGNALEGCSEFKDLNASALRAHLPVFPLSATNTCGSAMPVIVSRQDDRAGLATLRAVSRTATRRDYDRIRLVCRP